jgi:predicted nucleic acid-binding protein
MSDVFHIADADALISMLSKTDANHEKAKTIIQKAGAQGEPILFPATAIAEAITTMQVRLQDPALAKEAVAKVAASALTIVPVDAEILEIAVGLYNPEGSRKNTMFDATVAATAKKLGTQTLFSFDGWYRGQGFTLLVDRL